MTDAVLERGWELLAHNWEQGELLTSFAQDPAKERDIILRSLAHYEKFTGRKAKGWLSSSLRGTMQTADILAERSEEHTSELQSLMRSSYAVFCLKKKK